MSTGLPLLDRIETDKRLEASLKPIHFHGSTYDVVFDCKRLNAHTTSQCVFIGGATKLEHLEDAIAALDI